MLNEKTKKIYMVGIKGTGMSSLAVLLKKLGYRVSGSDASEKFFTEIQLKDNRIAYHNGFDAEQLATAKPDLVIASTAYNDRNPEIAQARLLGTPVATYPEIVGALSVSLKSIAVCGSHGKTTTTAMLGTVMQTNRQTITLTGTVADTTNKGVKKPTYFVFEADEYQDKLRYYHPRNVILTNIDFDHPDFFKNARDYAKVYSAFIGRILGDGGFVLYNYDDPETRKVLKSLKGRKASYGFHPKSDYIIKDISDGVDAFSIWHNGTKVIDLKLSVFGLHTILNASAATIMSLRLGIAPATITKELGAFAGVKRRMEAVKHPRYTLIDDYGHHPTEIAATLKALRGRFPKQKIVTVFQAHTFSRTKALLKQFGASFGNSDTTIVLDIFPSAREAFGDVHAHDLVREMKKHRTKVVYESNLSGAARYIKKHIRGDSIILTIGASHVWQLKNLL